MDYFTLNFSIQKQRNNDVLETRNIQNRWREGSREWNGLFVQSKRFNSIDFSTCMFSLSFLMIYRLFSTRSMTCQYTDTKQTYCMLYTLSLSSFPSLFRYALEKYKVIIIEGETGCGKSTQLPQYLYEGGWASDGRCIAITEVFLLQNTIHPSSQESWQLSV